MKKNFYYWLVLLLVLTSSSFIFIACGGGDEDINPGKQGETQNETTLADPEGTAIASIVYGQDMNHQYYDYGYTNIGICDMALHGINLSFRCQGDYMIASVGKVRGLADVNFIPTSGWNKNAGVLPGYGYVAKINETYVRIYAIDYVKDAIGNIIGATFKYQYPFVPEK